MTGRERMIQTLRFEQPDRPPHFEAKFELERDAFGLAFPDDNSWAGCTRQQKDRQIATCMEIYGRIIERYQWDALAVYSPWGDPEGVAAAKKRFGQSTLIGGMLAGAVWCFETIHDWEEFALTLAEAPEKLHQTARLWCDQGVELIDRMADAGADFMFMPHDVAGNGGPFVSPATFAQITAPYLTTLVQRVKQRGMIAIVHSDGMLMPILDQILALGADALMSIDPMAGMDIAQVKKLTYGKMALMGNVQCNLLQEGPREAIRRSTLNALQQGVLGGGYIFSTSNTIFPGMPLENYEYMLSVYRQFCQEAAR